MMKEKKKNGKEIKTKQRSTEGLRDYTWNLLENIIKRENGTNILKHKMKNQAKDWKRAKF